MLRVALTGGLGSGKSSVAAIFRELGAPVMEADAVGLAMMEPGQPVYQQIVRVFGPEVVLAGGQLNRKRLAELCFRENRLEELNAIVHPAVVAEQERWMQQLARSRPDAVAVYETALLFEASRAAHVPGWRDRFDHVILVTAPEELRIARYVERVAAKDGSAETPAALAAEARSRMAAQLPDTEKIALSDTVLVNDGSLATLRTRAEAVYRELQRIEFQKRAGAPASDNKESTKEL